MSTKLTPKQESFIQHYHTSGNGAEAYKIAYPKSNTWTRQSLDTQVTKMLSNPKIILRLKELQEETAIENKIDRNWVLEKAKMMVERSLEPEAIFTRSGDFTGEFKYDSAGVGRGLEIINKMCGFNEPEKLDVKSEVKQVDWWQDDSNS